MSWDKLTKAALHLREAADALDGTSPWKRHHRAAVVPYSPTDPDADRHGFRIEVRDDNGNVHVVFVEWSEKGRSVTVEHA